MTSIINYFHTSRVAHSVKDLEKALPSVASINGMQVKDYLQALQDENKIRVEKIGSGNWYWAFAGEDTRNKQQMVDKATEERDRVQTAVEDVQSRLEEAVTAREESGEGTRQIALEQHRSLVKQIETLKAELAGHAENDPVEAERRHCALMDLMEKTESYTDQISELERFLLDELQMDKETLGYLKLELYGEEYDAEDETLKELQEPSLTR